jgi:beta-glucosidase
MNGEESLDVSFTIQNTGKRKGKETAMLFIRDHYASITPSVKRLKRFKKIELAPGESETVGFSISKEDLKFVGQDNTWRTEPGRFTVMVSNLEKDFILK